MSLLLKLTSSGVLKVLVILSFMISVASLAFVPSDIPIHFAADGPDSFMNKYIGLFLLPVIMLIFHIISVSKLSFKNSLVVWILFFVHMLIVVNALLSN